MALARVKRPKIVIPCSRLGLEEEGEEGENRISCGSVLGKGETHAHTHTYIYIYTSINLNRIAKEDA